MLGHGAWDNVNDDKGEGGLCTLDFADSHASDQMHMHTDAEAARALSSKARGEVLKA